jgi:hypothetical protein
MGSPVEGEEIEKSASSDCRHASNRHFGRLLARRLAGLGVAGAQLGRLGA